MSMNIPSPFYKLLRPFLRVFWAKKLNLNLNKSGQMLELKPSVTPLVRIKNEDVWIETIIRTLTKVFPKIIVLDNCSTDQTLPILESLKSDGFPLNIISYSGFSGKQNNVVKNLVLDCLIDTQWFYLIDGDELQFEEACQKILKFCESGENIKYYKMATHARYISPESVLLSTPPFCSDVRYKSGRIFNVQKVRFVEPGRRDPLIGINNEDIQKELADYPFLDDIFFLHAAFTQRSTIKAWQGVQSASPSHEEYRKLQYVAEQNIYEKLEIFPKEFLECRYSDHNPYRQQIISAPGIDFC